MNIRGLILFYIARKNCATLDEICNNLKINENTAKIALSRLAKEHYITRRWLRTPEGKRFRLYCISSTRLKEFNV
ncbi:sulfolobus plasmid regulator [Sulfurisphaera ohwakuensis]|uniref:Putative ArsR family transcriptional regulator n=1 Tax=Sulfurisphaera ohwakuensis TaxID=69656 RepID=A0A650CD67_SULOH|nr:sulfolobus plasmid regulator [Sulfurisphaera ohwakuensis]MBB5255179.1 putative ArsR family transcriptional regulator [Sulfurisphaera ohwakuensis]QGR15781.1 sulfolobus plasmid regulator [Sulfurisphaera ohwakuensis]